MRYLLAILFLLSAPAVSAHTAHPPSPAVNGNGLLTRVLLIGADRNRNRLTVSVRIINTAEAPAYLAIVGPEPVALDNKGGIHRVSEIAGIASCRKLHVSSIDNCLRNHRDMLPGTAFTLLPPQVPTLVNLQFKAEDLPTDAMVSFTMNVAVARGKRPANRRSSEAGLDYINIHLPLLPVN